MSIDFKVSRGKPILGATLDKEGVNFAIFSRNGKKIILELYENYDDTKPTWIHQLNPKENKTGDIWHIYVSGVKPNTFYGWRIYGPYKPDEGNRFDVTKLLIDPYAKAVSGTYDFSESCLYTHKLPELEALSEKDFTAVCKSMIIDDSSYDWGDDKHPRIPLKDTVIYEMHVGLFTMNKNSKAKHRGTYKGVLEKVGHLKELGITAIELLPIFEFNKNSIINTNPRTGELLKDVWGYNPIAFFAPTANYSCSVNIGDQVFEFKDFVKELHKEGIEVILDVVYNHTGEGNQDGPTLSFKGLDNSVYYLLENNKMHYCNYSGTGNTFNCSHTVVKELIIDSLRYWVTEMHVDGFRFDLAAILGRDSKGNWVGDLSLLKDIADDPILSGSKLIAEGWDAAGGYYVGEFPVGWAEWNGKFRDTVRKFVKGDEGQIQDLATRLVGSPDLFRKFGRKPYHSINFITAHDGFTMWDLVSYNRKHNYENGEENRDGANDNHSWNHGTEGETRNHKIVDLRKRQMKNFITILMLSQGVPMILMGDEMAKTQIGNNNAYCQDNDTNWLDWSRMEDFKEIFSFTKNMIKFRQKHHSLKRNHFFLDKDLSGDGIPDITWHGIEAYKPDWSNESRAIAFMISGEDFVDKDTPKDNDIYVALNSYWEPLWFELPKLPNKKWYRVIDTSKHKGETDFKEIKVKSDRYLVNDRSSIILISK